MHLEGRALRWAAGLAALILRGIAASVRWEELNSGPIRDLVAAGQPFLLVFWHGRLAMVPHAYHRIGGKRVKILISEHRDGELVAMAMSYWGYEAVRGSSRRGAVKGARGMLRAAREGYDLAITPDGPRGPRESLQEGVLELAKWTGLPIVPVCFSARHAWEFSSWDRFLLPWPGTRGIIVWGDPIWTGRGAEAGDSSLQQKDLEARLQMQRRQCDILAGRRTGDGEPG